MIHQKSIGMLLFVGVFSICLLLSPHLTHANCITDWIAQNPLGDSITPQESSDIECILGWFETSFPGAFYPASNTIIYGPLAYRYYSGSGAFLAAWKSTSLKIVYLGPLSANCVMELGTVDFWKTMVCSSIPAVTPGLWTGSNVQFFVSSDGTKITSTGSSIIKGGVAYSFVLGPNTFTNVGACGNINLTINTSGDDIPIKDNAFAFTTNEGTMIEGNFSSGKSSSGTYSVNLYISSCGGYAVGSGVWSAASSDAYSSAESNGQSNRHEIVIENTITEIKNP
ncbi:MAG: hypothetical protein HY881_04380 [Deltaproteobacteria bacterium]|nr:hypothetical protein [Deltaproteobacteria bacterium]